MVGHVSLGEHPGTGDQVLVFAATLTGRVGRDRHEYVSRDQAVRSMSWVGQIGDHAHVGDPRTGTVRADGC